MVGEGRIKGVGGIGVAEETGTIFVSGTVLVDRVVATAVIVLSPSCVGVVVRGYAVQAGKIRKTAKSNQSLGFMSFTIF